MADTTNTPAKFALGRILATPGALAAIPQPMILEALRRHRMGDWGDCCPEDAAENDRSLAGGFRIFSVYHTHDGVKFWIITEADRSATTLLLPEEY